MECPKPSVVSAVILLVHVMAAAEPGIALKMEPTGTASHIPPILHCAPAPAARSSNLSAFRGDVLALLGALPVAAAAAPPTPRGFVAAVQSGGAFGRALCFGVGARRHGSVVPGYCLKCLSAAAQDVADGCHGRRRGAVWRAGCFLSYADTDAPTAREEAWRGWFYDDGTPTAAAAAVGTCVAHRTAAECSRCLNESARVVPALKEGRQLSLLHGDVVVVVGYSCYLRVPLFTPTTRWLNYAVGVFDVAVVVLIEILGLLFCIRTANQFNPA